MTATDLPTLRGIHHLKVAVSDLDAALDFYRRALGARRLPELDHRRRSGGELYAYVCEVPGLGPQLELRLDPAQAAAHRGFDAVTIAVDNLASLTAWGEHLDAARVLHSEVLASIEAWVIVVEDPDGNRFRLYTLEQHEPELPPDEDSPWVTD